MNRFDNMSKDAMARVEEIMNSTKLNEFLHRKEEEEKKKTLHSLGPCHHWRGSSCCSHRIRCIPFLYSDYLEDFEDDFDDDFDDDFFEG